MKGGGPTGCSSGRAVVSGRPGGRAAVTGASKIGLATSAGMPANSGRSRITDSTRSRGFLLCLRACNAPALRLPGERWEKSARGSFSAAAMPRRIALLMAWSPELSIAAEINPIRMGASSKRRFHFLPMVLPAGCDGRRAFRSLAFRRTKPIPKILKTPPLQNRSRPHARVAARLTRNC